MKKKKMKLILKVVLIIFIIYLISVVYKFIVLTKINQIYSKNKDISNYYFYIKSKTANTYYTRKDNIIKIKLEGVINNENVLFWENEETNEKLTFNEEKKTYTEFDKSPFSVNIPSSMLNTDLIGIRLVYALNPTTIITTNGEDYNIMYLLSGINKEKVDKNTGLLVLADGVNGKREYKYGSVTDKDVEKPDISQYRVEEEN